MQITQYLRMISMIGTAAVLTFLQGCAVMSHAIDPEVGACIDKVGRMHLMVQNIETVRGSPHTPFDYGNKSVSRIAYEVVIPGANGKWTESDIQVFVAKFRQEKVKGTVTVTNNDLSLDLFVSARDLPNYSLVPIRGVVAWRGEEFLRSAQNCVDAS